MGSATVTGGLASVSGKDRLLLRFREGTAAWATSSGGSGEVGSLAAMAAS